MAPMFKAAQRSKTHLGDERVHFPTPAGRPRRRTTRLRPLLEGLEDRRLPASFLVTSAADSGPGTLRDVIGQANANGVLDEIRFRDGLPQIVLTSGQLSIASKVNIIGPAGGITIARSQATGTPAFRILQLSGEVRDTQLLQTSVRLENVTIAGGMASDGLGGGGILSSGQNLTLVGSTVSGNSSTSVGGGIRSAGLLGSLTLQASTIRGNSAITDGGGIQSSGSLTLTATSVSGNSARNGGGIDHLTETVTIVNCTFSGNSATRAGGAIFSRSSAPGLISVVASTLSGNSAAELGGGIGISGIATLTNTIVALNSGGELAGTMLGDHNLIGDASGGLDPSTNLLNVADPRLGPLQDNGGPTATMALLPGSPAIDAGASLSGVGFDQRFTARPAGGAFDIGAFESGNDRPGLVVNTAADVVNPTDGVTSLREAITFANAKLGPDAITFDPIVFAGPHTVTLAPDLGQLSIQDDLTITGPAVGLTIARSTAPDSPRFRILDIPNAAPLIGRPTTVRLDRLTITGGDSGGQDGGGIRALGALTVVDCTIRGNSNGDGNRGGGIFAGQPLTVVDSTINDNSSRLFGGGIFADQGVTLVNSTITRNTAGGQGGGVFGPLGVVSNSTIVGNTGSDGGGIAGTNNLTVNNSIVAGNAGGDLSGVVTGQANFIGDASGGLNPSTNHLDAGDPGLGPLQDNGGPTQTMVLLPGSPAIDAGINALAVDGEGDPLPDDQRGAGHPRVVNGTVDIGAFEFQSAPTADVLDVSPDPRTTSVSSISIVFSEALAPASFTLADLSLTRDGGANLLTGSQTLNTTDNITWTLGNLAGITAAAGAYVLALTMAGVTDAAGNPGAGSVSDSWAVSPSLAAYPAAVLADAPAGYWRLGEASGTIAADASGNGRNGTYQNGVALGAAGALAGDPDTAAQFDSADDVIVVPDSPALAPAQLTLEVWVFAGADVQEYDVVAMKTSSALGWADGYGLYYLNGAIHFFVNSYSSPSVQAPIAAQQWVHVVGTYDGAALRLYLNGALARTLAYSQPIVHIPSALTIGASGPAGGNSWGGRIDDVAVYGTALSAARVAAHYAAATGGPMAEEVLNDSTAIDRNPAATSEPVILGLAEEILLEAPRRKARGK